MSILSVSRATTELAGTFFALLAVLVDLAVLAGLVVAVSGGGALGARLRGLAAEHGLGAAAAVTGTATLGSLFYSEVVGFEPCRLCWFQRVFAYPLAVILVVALVRYGRRLAAGERPVVAGADVWPYATALAAIGALIAAYHRLVQAYPTLESSSCEPGNPCSGIYVQRFGLVTIPWMALSAFCFTLVVAVLVRQHRNATAGDDVAPKTPTTARNQ